MKRKYKYRNTTIYIKEKEKMSDKFSSKDLVISSPPGDQELEYNSDTFQCELPSLALNHNTIRVNSLLRRELT